MFRSVLAGLAAVLAAQGVAWSQFDSIYHRPAGPVTVEGFLALHDNGNGFWAFSAFRKHWHRLVPATSEATLLGAGDWVALLKVKDGPLLGYSARLDATAAAPCAPGDLLYYEVGDDVVVLIAQGKSGLEAFGYSGQTNQWRRQPLCATTLGALRIETSRFVVGICDPCVPRALRGFAARTGEWESIEPTGFGSLLSLEADGNVVLAAWLATSPGVYMAAAFSGVVGEWSRLRIDGNDPPVELAHNVAFTYAYAGGLGQVELAAYSAYNGTWARSGLRIHRARDERRVRLGDNLVVYKDLMNGELAAIGARPGINWASFAIGDAIMVEPDAAAALAGGTLYGFSGVSGGVWVSEPFAGGITFGYPGAHLIQLVDGADVIHSFGPAHSAWGPPRTLSGGTPVTEDAAALLSTGGQLAGYSTRWNHWTAGPTLGSPTVASNGSVFAIQETAAGPTLGDIHVWDERRDRFLGPFNLGGASTMHASSPGATGRNLVLFEGPGSIEAFGLQRSRPGLERAVDGSGLTPTLPLAAPPVIEENVAVFVAGKRLWAYGSTSEMHIWYAWPNGTEYHRWSSQSGPLPPHTGNLRFSTDCTSGRHLWVFLDTARRFDELWLPGIVDGPLWLPTYHLLLETYPTGSAFHETYPLPAFLFPAGFQLWFQSLREMPAARPLLSFGPGAAWIF